VAAKLPVLIAPVIDFGYYPAFAGYPGSQHLSAPVFIALVEEILEALLRQGARTISIINTGVSTEGPLQIAVRNIQARSGSVIAIADIRRLGKSSDHLLEQELGGHGDEHETSLIMAIEPASVRPGLAVPDYGHMRDEPKTVFYRPARYSGDPASGANYSKTGVRGDPTLATAEKGRAILAAMVDDIVDGLTKLDPLVR
jgi:creatinine amidohydrolase/Fe(II)-dependent formamide hydrolase-like protein